MNIEEPVSEKTEVIGDRSRLSVEDPPAWVVKSKVRDFARQNGEPVTCLLSERRIHAPLRTTYFRNVNRLESSQAVQHLSRVEISFDPHVRALAIHSISIFRNGALINHAKLDAIELIRREQRLESGIINGEVSALLLLKDVRIGDVLDLEYSIRDEGSLFAAEASTIEHPMERYPMGAWNTVWIDEPDRFLSISEKPEGVEYAEEQVDGLLVRTWSARSVAALEPEPNLPPDVFVFPMLQISPFRDWRGISAGFLSKWNFVPDSREALDEELAAIKQGGGDDWRKIVDLAVSAARDAVRYQNYSPGLLAVVPDNISTIWDRRFGDCKEKTLLLVWLLREYGAVADPVLVHSNIGKGLPGLLPSPHLFNHVVTRVRVGAEVLWIDPTDLYRGGRPSSWTTLPFHWGLPLTGDATGLVEIPGTKPGHTFVNVMEKVTGKSGSAEADYDVTFNFGGHRADHIRGLMDSLGNQGLQRAIKNHMEPMREGIELETDIGYDDDRDANRITLRVKGTRPEAIKPTQNQEAAQLLMIPFSFQGMLPQVERVSRTHPFWLGSEDQVEHVIELVHPEMKNADYPAESVETPAFAVKASSHLSGGNPVFKFNCSMLSDRIEPSAMRRYKEDREKALRIVEVSYYVAIPRKRTGPHLDEEDKWGAGTTSSGGQGQNLSNRAPLAPRQAPIRRRRSQPAPVYRSSGGGGLPMQKVNIGFFALIAIITILRLLAMAMAD